jgi:hypothetical protein
MPSAELEAEAMQIMHSITLRDGADATGESNASAEAMQIMHSITLRDGACYRRPNANAPTMVGAHSSQYKCDRTNCPTHCENAKRIA